MNRNGQVLTYYRGAGSFHTRSAANKARQRPKYTGSGALPSMAMLCRDTGCKHNAAEGQDDEGEAEEAGRRLTAAAPVE